MGAVTRALRDIPAVRALAEREAKAFSAAWADATNLDYLAWGRLDTPTQEKRIATHLALFTDLSRPASRDAVCRLVAEAVGLECGATAPILCWTPREPGFRDSDGAPEGDDWPEGWWLDNGLGDLRFFSSADWCPDDYTRVDGLPSGADRATAALLTIALHVLTPRPTP